MNNVRKMMLVLIAGAPLVFQHVTAQSLLDQATSLLKKQTSSSTSSQLGASEIGDAFKQALQIGSDAVVSRLGKQDGFNKDPVVHIPLPKQLDTAKSMLGKVGMSGITNDLELKLNRAAEAATPKAKQLFIQAISAMTFADAKSIYDGPQDSATRYFQGKMTTSLSTEMRPIVDKSLSEVGAIQSYDKFMGAYKALPFVPDVKAGLSDHVVSKCIEGIFHYLAKEEAAIRADPARQTTALLKKVFGVNK